MPLNGLLKYGRGFGIAFPSDLRELIRLAKMQAMGRADGHTCGLKPLFDSGGAKNARFGEKRIIGDVQFAGKAIHGSAPSLSRRPPCRLFVRTPACRPGIPCNRYNQPESRFQTFILPPFYRLCTKCFCRDSPVRIRRCDSSGSTGRCSRPRRRKDAVPRPLARASTSHARGPHAGQALGCAWNRRSRGSSYSA